MKKNHVCYLLLLLFVSCESVTDDEVRAAMVGQNYFIVDNQNDSIPIKFSEECVIECGLSHAILLDQWEVRTVLGKIILHCNGEDYVLMDTETNGFEFYNAKYHLKLVRANGVKFKVEDLMGDWMEAEYAHLKNDNPDILPPPPCIHFDSFLIPGISFGSDSAIINDFCYKRKRSYSVNLTHGVVHFSYPCVPEFDQWEIKKLTKDEMVVDMPVKEGNKITYEYGKRFIRAIQ